MLLSEDFVFSTGMEYTPIVVKLMPHFEKWKQPPIAKVYEALSAIADGRVKILRDNAAEVTSSDGSKTYTVRWSKNRKVITSTDNASKYGHYVGYPIIAVLMKLGDLPIDATMAQHLRGVPWKELNTRFKRDYDAAVDFVLEAAQTCGADIASLRAAAKAAYDRLASLSLIRPRGGRLDMLDTGNS